MDECFEFEQINDPRVGDKQVQGLKLLKQPAGKVARLSKTPIIETLLFVI
jgi:hypothetical protein